MTNRNEGSPPIRFITVEGGEGAGKTSLLSHMEKYLRDQGIAVVRTREPGGTTFGEHMRGWLLNHNDKIKISAKAELLLFLAARAQHIEEVILPAFNAGKVVICDRFNDSTVAYQGAGRQLGMEWVSDLCDMICGAISPDLTFYLDVDPQVGLARTRRTIKENAAAGQIDRIESEKLEFHQRVRDAFRVIAEEDPERFYRIDANQPQEAVIEAAINVISQRFKYV